MRACASAGTPGPLSRTSIATPAGSTRAASATAPPLSVARSAGVDRAAQPVAVGADREGARDVDADGAPAGGLTPRGDVAEQLDEHAWLFIEPNAARAGAGRITLAVAGLDALLARLAARRIAHEPIETYSNGVRHVNVPDPMGHDRVRRAAGRRECVASIAWRRASS
jgi:hypothetical protein